MADVYLTVGVILVVIYLIYAMVQESKKEKQKKALAASTDAEGEVSKDE